MILLIYTVIPLPLYLCVLICLSYTGLFLILTTDQEAEEEFILTKNQLKIGALFLGTKLALHLCIHLLGVHLYILTQVVYSKT